MGRFFLVEFDQQAGFYACRYCHAHLALSRDLISYIQEDNEGNFINHLFAQVKNVMAGEPIATGNDCVRAPAYCVQCYHIVGTYYVKLPAHIFYDPARHKVGLIRARCLQWNSIAFEEIPIMNINQMANLNPVQDPNPDADQDPDLEPEQELNPNEDVDHDPDLDLDPDQDPDIDLDPDQDPNPNLNPDINMNPNDDAEQDPDDPDQDPNPNPNPDDLHLNPDHQHPYANGNGHINVI